MAVNRSKDELFYSEPALLLNEVISGYLLKVAF